MLKILALVNTRAELVQFVDTLHNEFYFLLNLYMKFYGESVFQSI